jgi:MbtH protein
MDLSEPDARPQYAVVVNDEEQHSLWPAILPVPAGWREVGFRGDEERCLEMIAELWPDITPRSARRDRAVAVGRG